MNDVYFACTKCMDYVDAGYRWAVSTLYPNRWHQFPVNVSVPDVFNNAEYWSAISGESYYASTLPAVRRFLLDHVDHSLLFGDIESFVRFDDITFCHLEWLDTGSLHQPANRNVFDEPRYFAEHPALLYKSWDQVEEHCLRSNCCCTWAENPAAMAAAKQVFTRAASRLLASEA